MHKFINKFYFDSNNKVHLWTIQHISVWENLKSQGQLFVDDNHPYFSCNSHLYMRPAYDWMRKQMALRIPAYEGHYPWWAYNFFLDLRNWRWHTSHSNDWFVRIELAVPTQNVLLSSYSAWDKVLSRGYLPDAIKFDEYECELEQWWKELEQAGIQVQHVIITPYAPYSEPWETQLQNSWERIFDVARREHVEIIQATFEKLELADVIHVTKFRSAFRGNTASNGV